MRPLLRGTPLGSAILVSFLITSNLHAQERWRVSGTDAGDPATRRPGERVLERGADRHASRGAPDPPLTRGPVIVQFPGWPKIVGGHPSFSPTPGMVFVDLAGHGLVGGKYIDLASLAIH